MLGKVETGVEISGLYFDNLMSGFDQIGGW